MAKKRITQAVVVIHGIGEQRPMDTLGSIVAGRSPHAMIDSDRWRYVTSADAKVAMTVWLLLEFHGVGCGLRAAGCGLRVMNCGLRFTGWGLRALRCVLRVETFEMPNSCAKIYFGLRI